MKRCDEYEVELSAMLDGETDPATAVELLDHVSECSSCRGFYRELRSFQSLVDDMSPAIEVGPAVEAASAGRPRRWFGWLGAPPRLAWGAAAVVVVAFGLWAAGSFDRGGESTLDLQSGTVTIELEGDKLSVDDERFVELASEILKADKRYQYQMYVILDQVRQNEAPGESPLSGEMIEDDERGEYSGEAFAHIGGRRVLD